MGRAIAGPALDEPADGTVAEPKVDPNSGAVLTEPSEETPVEYGVGLRIRNTRVPKGLLELFVERSGGGASNLGLGGELIRRRGNVELQLGFEYEKISVGQGVWIEKGKSVAAGDEADFVLGPDEGSDLGWFTMEFTFMNHAPINKYVAFRYGGGAGIGILTGSLKRFNVRCNGATNGSTDPGCHPAGHDDLRGPSGQPGLATPTEGGDTPQPYDLPPVFPVVNAIIGVQIKPSPQFTINLEGGIRLIPFFGMSTAYFF